MVCHHFLLQNSRKIISGAKVYLACRNEQKGHQAAKNVVERTGVPLDRVPVMVMDLSSLKSVRTFLYDFKRREYFGP